MAICDPQVVATELHAFRLYDPATANPAILRAAMVPGNVGAGLAELARLQGLERDRVVARHIKPRATVDMMDARQRLQRMGDLHPVAKRHRRAAFGVVSWLLAYLALAGVLLAVGRLF